VSVVFVTLVSRPRRTAALTEWAGEDDLMQLDIRLFPFKPCAGRIWELRHHGTSYDAWYVAISEALNLPLATLDEPLSKSARVACKFLTPAF
jgi:predicted nucleic acid-binding protein